MGGLGRRGRGAVALGVGRVSSALAALLLTSACSLEGLDRFQFPSCNADGRTGCEQLNARDGIPDDGCMIWQCDMAGRDCTFGLRDLDHDGYIAASCGGDDCEDDVANAHPDAVEGCDGADNDCNGVIDDVDPTMSPATSPPSTVLTGTSGPTFLDLSDAADGFFAVWQASGQTRSAIVTQMAPETASTTLLGSTNADSDRGLFDATAVSGCPDRTRINLLPTPCELRGTGAACSPTVPCTAGEYCLGGACASECSTSTSCAGGAMCSADGRCVGGVCSGAGAPAACGTACGTCPLNFYCDHGACTADCSSAVHCPAGQLCSPTGQCALCSGSQICVTAPDGSRICEQPVQHRTPEAPMECQTNAECSDGLTCNGLETCEPRSGATLIDARGCRMRMPPTPCMGMGTCDEALDACIQPIVHPCDFQDIRAAWAGGGEVMTASVNIDGCSDGRLRVGLVATTDSPPADILWGGGDVSTTWAGVDLDVAGCTGESRPAADARGARRASIAALVRDPVHGRDFTEALAAWTAVPLASTGPAPVEILGLWREQMTVSTQTVRFVDGAGDGRPLRLADATTSTHVGVASYALGAAAGYVVAYARQGGGVSVSTLPHLGSVGPDCPNTPACVNHDVGADLALHTADDGVPGTSIPQATPQPRRTTPDMGTPMTSTIDSTTTVVGDVSVAAGGPLSIDPPTTQLRVALAWATSDEIVIALTQVDTATDTLSDGTRLRIASAAARDVRIVHVEAGISLAGQFASGNIAASEVGGFVVTWATNAGTFAARVSDHTGALVAPGAVLLGDSGDQPLAFVDYDDMGAHPHVRVAAHQGDAVVVYPSVCGPPAP